MVNYEETIKSVRTYLVAPPGLRLGANRFPPYAKEENYFRRLLTRCDEAFVMEITVDKDLKELRYRLSFLNDEGVRLNDRSKMTDYIVKSNIKHENDLCFAGVDSIGELFVEIIHNYEKFPIDYKQIRVFEDICIKRLTYDAENIKKIFE